MVQVDLKLSLSVLNEIVHATSNPKVALQLIEGTYVSPRFPEVVYHTFKKQNVTIKSFDKWDDRITYTYPKYRYYNADGSDWSGYSSKEYSDARLQGTSTDSCTQEEWWAFHQAFKDNKDAEFDRMMEEHQSIVNVETID